MSKMVFGKAHNDKEREIIRELLDKYNKEVENNPNRFGKFIEIKGKPMYFHCTSYCGNCIIENKNLAERFCEAIKTISEKPNNLENLERYLTSHFSEWMQKYANDPESFVSEFVAFATMDI